ncbi:hypothetical protein Herbaro_12620 [Herbaspirillum sp. WKF16]|nr:hypothetical protein [Herbaspirillum sp. WKF16]WDZ94340.1 hypothetical protein Herbaro_12620 [Herbaspirillum sp. WKF16]
MAELDDKQASRRGKHPHELACGLATSLAWQGFAGIENDFRAAISA